MAGRNTGRLCPRLLRLKLKGVLFHEQTEAVSKKIIICALVLFVYPQEMTDQLSLKALQVVLVGEHLRNTLHAEEDPVMIKDRRYHLRMYSCCFVGRDLVDWLIRHGDASSRGGAVQCMNVLLDHGIIHHGKGNASEEGKSLVSCKLPVKLLCVYAHIFS